MKISHIEHRGAEHRGVSSLFRERTWIEVL